MKFNLMKKEYLTTTQAARYCNVTRFTIRNWVNSDMLKATKTAGGHRRILKQELIKFIKKNNISEVTKKEEHYLKALNSKEGKAVKDIKEVSVYDIAPRVTKEEFAAIKELLHKSFYRSGKYLALVKSALSKRKKTVL
ncbi:MAG: helix-turn-helix domain-containing protein [Candidatus Omnitrophica bacterium]|nr:helix-turn-helix domain-containing protein [Candidatus Omnitrophota bacterium]